MIYVKKSVIEQLLELYYFVLYKVYLEKKNT